MTSLVSEWTVSRLVRLCVAMADGSGEVSVILDLYAALSFVEKVFACLWAVWGGSAIILLTLRLWLEDQR